MKTFEHGGQIEKFALELGCNVSEIIDLSSNINFVKPQINVDFNTLDISSYPTYDKLYEKIASNYGVTTGISGSGLSGSYAYVTATVSAGGTFTIDTVTALSSKSRFKISGISIECEGSFAADFLIG